ncbi:MAG: hypothetical protein UV26_C0030G0014 [candidate division WWE3 bacterium GW2011_GWF2_42_42]|uniref:Uncharacterized protein n=1 Tax=candidate division WWE3 bacterium GW2011_GWF2_42_42 TaxID=1619142 RepID=A0A0G1ADF4_UNCKA|nr:MAG: hypothetical protein UV26_C0030G0014 [candidate division WWE3 bacterium GW2011_GWF2_42_42]
MKKLITIDTVDYTIIDMIALVTGSIICVWGCYALAHVVLR